MIAACVSRGRDEQHPLTNLDRRQRRLEITASVISALLTCSLLLVIYYLIPFDD